MRTIPLVALLLVACGGEADLADPMVDETTDDTTADDTTDETEEPAVDDRVIPLCEGSVGPDEIPDACQTLVYGRGGYCNRWTPCSELGQ